MVICHNRSLLFVYYVDRAKGAMTKGALRTFSITLWYKNTPNCFFFASDIVFTFIDCILNDQGMFTLLTR